MIQVPTIQSENRARRTSMRARVYTVVYAGSSTSSQRRVIQRFKSTLWRRTRDQTNTMAVQGAAAWRIVSRISL